MQPSQELESSLSSLRQQKPVIATGRRATRLRWWRLLTDQDPSWQIPLRAATVGHKDREIQLQGQGRILCFWPTDNSWLSCKSQVNVWAYVALHRTAAWTPSLPGWLPSAWGYVHLPDGRDQGGYSLKKFFFQLQFTFNIFVLVSGVQHSG